jgi:hypothetical protein
VILSKKFTNRDEIRGKEEAEVKKMTVKNRELEQMQKWMNTLRDQQQSIERPLSKQKVCPKASSYKNNRTMDLFPRALF